MFNLSTFSLGILTLQLSVASNTFTYFANAGSIFLNSLPKSDFPRSAASICPVLFYTLLTNLSSPTTYIKKKPRLFASLARLPKVLESN